MKTSWPKTLIALTLLFLTLLFQSAALAHHPTRTTGYYCEGNALYLDVFYIEGDNSPDSAKHKLKDPCGSKQVCAPQPLTNPIYIEDASCVDINTLPNSGGGTTMKVVESPVNLGQQLTIGIGEDNVCHDQVKIDPTLDPNQNSLKVFGRLLNCHVTEQNCGCTNKHVQTTDAEGRTHCDDQTSCGPSDWPKGTTDECGETTGVNPYDNKQCFKTVVCDTNAEGQLDAPLITNNQTCNNSVHYQVLPGNPSLVKPTKDCRKVDHNVTVQNQPDLVDVSLSDDKRNVDKWLKGNIPTEVTAPVTQDCLNKVNKTGILSDAFGAQQFLCNGVYQFLKKVPVIGFVAGLADVCPKDTYVGGNDFDCFEGKTKVLSKAVVPENTNTAQVQDCSRVDFQQDGKTSEGNQKINDLSKELGGPNGYMSHTTPEYQLQLNHNVNLNTEGHVLTGDDVGPDINARCIKDCLAQYPKEICETNRSIECENYTTSTTTTTQTAKYACQQACFKTHDECEKACQSKTGHDRDNCNNECAITKDKCLKTCG